MTASVQFHSSPLLLGLLASAPLLPAMAEPLTSPLLLALVFLTISAGPVASSSLSGDPRDVANDSHALLSFKSLMSGPSLQALASWSSNGSTPVCQWRSVACGTRGCRRGRDVTLALPELGLLGKVSPAPGNLTYLRRLDLPSNRLHGTMPPELGHLRELRYLKLNYNSIQGSIPPSLSSCKQLRSVQLYSNKLQGQIPRQLTALRNLEELVLARIH